jgi:hypothetical protein
VTLVHVYRRDDGDYVLATRWRRVMPGCSGVFAYIGVCRWPGDERVDAQLKAVGTVVVPRFEFLAHVGALTSRLCLVQDCGEAVEAPRSGAHPDSEACKQAPDRAMQAATGQNEAKSLH